jgi:hypothetical protein
MRRMIEALKKSQPPQIKRTEVVYDNFEIYFFINIYRLIVGKKNMYLHYEFYIMFVHKKKKRSNQINIHFFIVFT